MLKSSVSVAASLLLVVGASFSVAGSASADDGVESLAKPTCEPVGTQTVCTFDVGKATYWTVPAGVTSVKANLFGAQGGSSAYGPGGLGGHTQADMSVTPGETFQVSVGGTPSKERENVWEGGFNGGGDGAFVDEAISAAGGGGASDIRVGPNYGFDNRVLVAGGGGGSSADPGGAGGGLKGGDAENGGGSGGTQKAGGKGGTDDYREYGKDGAFGIGGDGVAGRNMWSQFAAGGGGGWYGGGGGVDGGAGGAGGGGGSGYAAPSKKISGAELTAGVQSGAGKVTISYADTKDLCREDGAKTVCTFPAGEYTDWAVPAGVNSITADLYGAQGGTISAAAKGGLGGYTHAEIPTTSGQKFEIAVGTTPDKDCRACGGFNGGGDSDSSKDGSAGGGGSSDIKVGNFESKDRILVAGGGGGAAALPGGRNSSGGAGGGLSGTDGVGDGAGRGGTQKAGGSGGNGTIRADQHGGFDFGGQGRGSNDPKVKMWSAGGGGGGWYGGGGGAVFGAGGGGSGFVYKDARGKILKAGERKGDGSVTISYVTPPKTDSTDSDD